MSTETYGDMLECSYLRWSRWRRWRSSPSSSVCLQGAFMPFGKWNQIFASHRWSLPSEFAPTVFWALKVLVFWKSLVVQTVGDYRCHPAAECCCYSICRFRWRIAVLFPIDKHIFYFVQWRGGQRELCSHFGSKHALPLPPSCLPSVPHRSISLSISTWVWHDTLKWAAHLWVHNSILFC